MLSSAARASNGTTRALEAEQVTWSGRIYAKPSAREGLRSFLEALAATDPLFNDKLAERWTDALRPGLKRIQQHGARSSYRGQP